MNITRILVILMLLLPGCKKPEELATEACKASAAAGDAITCPVSGFGDRDYDLVVPDSYDGTTPLPLVVVMHGGSGDKDGALRTTCPRGSLDDPACIHAHANARGYALVFPNGTSDNVLKALRTWNAGGGVDNWRCTSGDACSRNIDDVGYIRTLIADVKTRIAVDPKRIFATGISNGGAMSHRLACQASDIFAAIAPVGGGMQLTVAEPCAPTRPVSVLHIHGTADTCWNYDGGIPSCAGGITGQQDKEHVSIQRTLDEWAAINGCGSPPVESTLDDTTDDGTTTTRFTYPDCDADLEHLRVNGGGHTWPHGQQYLGEGLVGPVWTDWGNEVLFDWFDAHPQP